VRYTKEEFKELVEFKEKIVRAHSDCDGYGWLNEGAPCVCMKVFRYIKRLHIAGVPKKYWVFRLGELKADEDYKNAVKRYLKNYANALEKGLGLLFLGPTGVGKTALMCEIAKYSIVKNHSTVYTTVARVMDDLMADPNMSIVGRFLQHSLVILDELDKVYIKKESLFVQRKLEDLIRALLNRNRIVLLGTNWTEGELEEVFGGMFLSLLKRYLLFITFSGDDIGAMSQNGWMGELESKFDYFHENIVYYAERMKGR
jgi:DNA replication protein DnaC